LPADYVSQLVVSAATWQKISGKHGLVAQDLIDAIEGRRWPYKIDPDARGDQWVLRVPVRRRTALVRLRPLGDGRCRLITAWFLQS